MVAATTVQLVGDRISYTTMDSIMKKLFSRKRIYNSPGDFAPQIKQLEVLKNKYFFDKEYSGYDFSIEFLNSSQVNAFITPTKQIVFTKGLLEKYPQEDTQLFILAHEIGHYVHKDSFTSLLKLLFVSTVTSLLSQAIVSHSSRLMSLRDSRKAEFAADCFAAAKLQQVYGNLDGGKRFFEDLQKYEPYPQWKQYFYTHPAHQDRLTNLATCPYTSKLLAQ